MPADQDFAAFYEANYERLVVQLFPVTGNLDDAEDVVQEAFARACLRWRRLRAYDLPAAWVRRVAFNLAVQGRRRARRALRLLARLGPSGEAPALSVEHVALVEARRTGDQARSGRAAKPTRSLGVVERGQA